jgi:hypothetical protein
MDREAAVHVLALVALVVGVGALLAGEFFHGVGFLVPAGGVLALVAVGVLTAAIWRTESAAPDATGEH